MKKYYSVIIFLGLLILISLFYNYHQIALKRPQSVHKWRQSNGTSIALNYYQGGMHFFHQETHNLNSDGGTSGKCCTSEIPFLYYSVALLYKVFGYHEFIFRIFNTILFFLGLFYLFLLLKYLLDDVFWSVSLSLLFFTSPLLVYYGNNFLTNSSALAFSIIGWYYFIRFWLEEKSKFFYYSMIVFFLAAAFKITSLFSLFAITGILVLEYFGFAKLKETGKVFRQPIKYALTILSILLILGSWLLYANSYNKKYDCTYFPTTIFPIWDLNNDEITAVIDNIRKLWVDEYFHPSVLFLIFGCFLFIIFFFKKNNKLFTYSIFIIIAEAIVYIALQFWTFADHDYYCIDLFILPILIIVSAFYILKSYNKLFKSLILKILFTGFLLFNIYYAHQRINGRYNGWMNDYPLYKDIYSITPFLRQIGISPLDTVISIPDIGNSTLYLMNQKGWTEYTDARFNKGKYIFYNRDSAGIQKSIDKGARYLIINGIKELYSKPYLQPFAFNLIGIYRNVLVFDLRDKTGRKNFNFSTPEIDTTMFCDAEQISSDGQYFEDDKGNSVFQNGNTHSNEYAFNGQFSCKLSESMPYGMTVRFKDLKNGEIFKINVLRKSNDKTRGGIIASSDSPITFYKSDYKVDTVFTNGWEKLKMDIYIPFELTGQELTIYLYNPNSEPVYFDDFFITRYESICKDFN